MNFTKNNQFYSHSRNSANLINFHDQTYHPLIVDDQIQYKIDQDIKIRYFQYVTWHILKQLNFLLWVGDVQFWKHLEEQEERSKEDYQQSQREKQNGSVVKFRLRNCLQSCLQNFAKRDYMMGSQFLTSKTSSNLRRSMFLWSQLKKVVLIIFYRISTAQLPLHKQIAVDNWYLDICKILEICLIYGSHNHQIVSKIVRNSLSNQSNEDQLIKQFQYLIKQLVAKLEHLCEQLHNYSIDFTLINQKQEFQNFKDPQENLTKNLMLVLFDINDTILTIQCIFKYFPARFRLQTIKQALIFKRIIMVFCKLRYCTDYQCNFDQHKAMFQEKIQFVLDNICQLIMNLLLKMGMLMVNLEVPVQDMYDIKKTFINIWYFTLCSSVISYEDRQDVSKIDISKRYCQEMVKRMIEFNLKRIRDQSAKRYLLNDKIMVKYNKANPSFKYLQYAKLFHDKYLRYCQYHLQRDKKLKRFENWRLPSLKFFSEKTKSTQIKANQYNDEFEDQLVLDTDLLTYDQEWVCMLDITKQCNQQSSDITKPNASNSSNYVSSNQLSNSIKQISKEQTIENNPVLQQLQLSSIGGQTQNYYFDSKFHLDNDSEVVMDSSLTETENISQINSEA